MTSAIIRTRLLAVALQGAYSPVWRDIETIDAPTPTTMVFRLRRPSSTFLETLADPPAMVEAGPFRLIQQTPARMDFRAFDDYWEGMRTLAGLRVDFYRSTRAAWAALLRGEADLLQDVPPASARLLSQHPEIRVYPPVYQQLYMMGFQLRHPLLRDIRVRRALNLAIDRKAIVDQVFAGYTVPARGPFSPDYWAAAQTGDSWAYDPGAALDLLKSVVGRRTIPIELVCLTSNQVGLAGDVAAAVEAQLQRINIRLKLLALPRDELVRRLASGEFDLCVMPHQVGVTSLWPYIFWHSGTHRKPFETGYTAADVALDALYTAGSPEAEQAAVRAVLDVMHRDPPAVFIAALPIIDAARRTWRMPDDAPDLRRSLSRWTLTETVPCGAP